MQKFIENMFNISNDASATLIITLLTFILGYVITATAFILNKYFERKSNRKIFIEGLKNLCNSLKRQEKALVDTIESLNILANKPWEYSKVDFFQIAVFKEMNYKDNFKSFFLGFENQFTFCTNKHLKRKAYNKTWENLSNIQFWSDRAFNDFNPILEKYNTHGNRRNIAITQLRQMWEKLFQNGPSKLNSREFEYFTKLDRLIFSYQLIPTNQRIRPYATNRLLILPIRILNRKYPSLPFVREINDKAMEVSHQYHEMELLLRHTRNQYQEYYHAFRKINKVNEMIIKILG